MAFLVNESVTTTDLNNVAVDLGDAEFSAFSTQKFGVDKLNAITADLVTSGVLRSGDMCKPILSGGTVSIQTGVIVFADGAKLRITAVQNITAVADNYIAARYDSTNGTCKLVSVESIPDETGVQYMVLAKVSADGTAITDLRTMAVVKTLSAATENNILCLSLNDIETKKEDSSDGYNHWYKEIVLTDYKELPSDFNLQRIALKHNGDYYYFLEVPDVGETVEVSPDTGEPLVFKRTGTGFKVTSQHRGHKPESDTPIYLI